MKKSGRQAKSSPLLDSWNTVVRRRGDVRAIAMAATGEGCTFRGLNERANAWLARHALEPAALAGRLVVFALPNGLAWLEVFLGLMRAGAIAVPLDPGEPAEAQCRIAEALRAGFWWDGARLVAAPNARRFRAGELCLVKLTSGTTGAPRPLYFTPEQMLADGRQVAATMGIRAVDLNYALIPFGHSYGLGNLTLPLLAQGVPLVCGSAPLPHAIADDFARWRPTVFPSVPAVWRALAAAEIAPGALASLRVAISAGAPLAPEVARDFAATYARRIHGFYGSSETGGIAYDRTGTATLAGRVGRAMRGVTIRVRRGQRIEVSSAAVFTVGNRRRAGKCGAWSPPDRVTIDRRGEMTLLGRRDATVKIAGRRVNLAEVAARLRALSNVTDAWVGTGGAHASEPVLGAALITRRSLADIRAELHADTPGWKIPKRWTLLEEFPLTGRGKPDTRALHAAVFGKSAHMAGMLEAAHPPAEADLCSRRQFP